MKNFNISIMFLFAVVIPFAAFPAHVKLNNGKVFDGEIVQDSLNMIVVRIGSSNISILKQLIVEIDTTSEIKKGLPRDSDHDTSFHARPEVISPQGLAGQTPPPVKQIDTVYTVKSQDALHQQDQQQTVAAKAKVNIAISTLQFKGIESSAADLISERLRAEMVTTGSFNVMERAQMVEILQEQNFQQSDMCSDQSCVVQMGQLLGVERIITGTVGKIGNLHTLSVKMINVRTGQIMYSVNEDCDYPLEKVLTIATKNVATQFAEAVRKEKFGGARITSVPPGAVVLLNNAKAGATPWSSEYLLPGPYCLDLSMPTYEGIKDTFLIREGATIDLSFPLKHGKEFLQKKSGKKRLIRLISAGGFTVVCGGIGGLFEYLTEKEITKRDQIASEYAMETSVLRREQLRSQYNIEAKTVNSYGNTRNVFYILAGAGAVGFVISLWF